MKSKKGNFKLCDFETMSRGLHRLGEVYPEPPPMAHSFPLRMEEHRTSEITM